MKNLQANPRYPTHEELYALMLEARRMRAAEMRRLVKAGAKAMRNLFSVRSMKGLRHA